MPHAVPATGPATPFFLLISVIFTALFLSLACAPDSRSLDERAQSIDQQLMCPVCPAETIDQSQAGLAKEMRDLVRQKLQAGESEKQILDYFVDKYDKSVLAEPPQEGFNLLVWIVPPIVFAGGLGLVWLAARKLGQRRWLTSPDEAQVWRADLDPYFKEVDEEFLAFEKAHQEKGKV